MSEPADPTGGWDRKYADAPSLFGDRPNDFLVARQAGFLPGQKVLVIADGSGRHGAWLASLGLKVDAFDISPEADRQAKALDARLCVTVHRVVCGWEGWLTWEGYDHIVALFIQFCPPEERARLFARMRTALVSGGTLHLLGYAEAQLELRTGGPADLKRLYSRDLLLGEFSGMEIDVLNEYRAELSEGTAHRGPSALIGLVARRI